MMRTNKFAFPLIILFVVVAQSPAAAQLLTNGGFESGDLSGWELNSDSLGFGGCQTDWNVSNVGGVAATGCQPSFSTSPFPDAPVEGVFAAYNSFDGAAATLFQLSQRFAIPANVVDAQLSWQDTVNIDHSFLAPTISREFLVDLYDDSGDVLLGNILSEAFDFSTVQHLRDWTPISVDVTDLLAANAGSEVELRFTNVIPEFFTGPGGFGLDDVSLTVSVVPEPISSGLIALGLMAFSLVRRIRTV